MKLTSLKAHFHLPAKFLSCSVKSQPHNVIIFVAHAQLLRIVNFFAKYEKLAFPNKCFDIKW